MSSKSNMSENLHTPEELNISFSIAKTDDLPQIETFLSQGEIDNLFTPHLSDPVRGITIGDRVAKKFSSGVWILARDRENQIIGCMAVVPAKINRELPHSSVNNISTGLNLVDWDVEKIVELSTVATDPTIKERLRVKGVGESMLNCAIQYVQGLGNAGFVTDSWLGGEMDGFIRHVLNKSTKKTTDDSLDFLIQMFTDTEKRGIDGPPTTVYIIPTTETDWNFVVSKQKEISELREQYDKLKTGTSV